MEKKLKKELKRIVGDKDLSDDPVTLRCYARDRLPIAASKPFIDEKIKPPELVVRPETTEEVIEIVKLANEYKVPIIPRSAGTGFMGQSIPTKESTIMVDMRKMDKIININREDRMVTVQPGICTETLDMKLARDGLIVGHDPGSASASTIGGAIANDGVGALADKYGVIRDMVRGLKVVLPTGELLDIRPVTKSSIGYNLRYLFIGAEGTLGIITEATLKMNPLGDMRFGFWDFPDFETAYRAVDKVIKLDAVPARFSINDEGRSSDFCDLAGKYINASVVACFVENKDEIERKYDIVNRTLEANGGTILPDKVSQNWWDTRHIYPNIKGVWQVLETAVPWSKMLEMRRKTVELLKKFGYDKGIRMGVFTIEPSTFSIDLYFDEKDEKDIQRYLDLEKDLRGYAFQFGGSMSQCHGIGLFLADWAKEELGFSLDIMSRIKRMFDPNNIMNPGKMGLEEEDVS